MGRRYNPPQLDIQSPEISGGSDRLSPPDSGDRVRDLRDREAVQVVEQTVPYVPELEPRAPHSGEN